MIVRAVAKRDTQREQIARDTIKFIFLLFSRRGKYYFFGGLVEGSNHGLCITLLLEGYSALVHLRLPSSLLSTPLLCYLL